MSRAWILAAVIAVVAACGSANTSAETPSAPSATTVSPEDPERRTGGLAAGVRGGGQPLATAAALGCGRSRERQDLDGRVRHRPRHGPGLGGDPVQTASGSSPRTGRTSGRGGGRFRGRPVRLQRPRPEPRRVGRRRARARRQLLRGRHRKPSDRGNRRPAGCSCERGGASGPTTASSSRSSASRPTAGPSSVGDGDRADIQAFDSDREIPAVVGS